MSMQTFHWEYPLLALAHQALDCLEVEEHSTHADQDDLEAAYAYCDTLTHQHSRTFYLASSLLPDVKRRAIRALYAFCRISDDLVDQSRKDAAAKLERWRVEALHPSTTTPDPVARAWKDARQRFGVPRLYAEQLIDGVATDLHRTRYANFDELAAYCYGVACTVGLMSMHIIGFAGPEAVPYAIRLGVALQLTNILRDVGEDWRSGRVYLPQDELDAFKLTEADLSRGKVDERWRSFMSAQIDRTRRLYAQALPGVGLLDPDGRFAIGSAAELYQAILKEIEANDYDVFNHRSAVSTWGKLRRLPGIWWRASSARYPFTQV